jgi:TatD DNase family protein
MAAHPKVVAVGEIGLDYYRDRAPRALQQEVFGLQLELAVELDLPVVIHTRDAGEQDRAATRDILAMLSEWIQGLKAQGSPLVDRPGVLHSYSSGAGFASQVFELGFMIGITGPVTFRKADELRQVVAEAPLERLLVETDAPFLTPHPYRGKRNEPAHVRYVVQKIAEIHNLPFEKVAQITSAGAERLFHWQVIK